MAYASVISQPGGYSSASFLTTGSAARNIEPVFDALGPLIDIPTPPGHILELASYPYEHIRHYGERWPHVHFTGTARDEEEIL